MPDFDQTNPTQNSDQPSQDYGQTPSYQVPTPPNEEDNTAGEAANTPEVAQPQTGEQGGDNQPPVPPAGGDQPGNPGENGM